MSKDYSFLKPLRLTKYNITTDET